MLTLGILLATFIGFAPPVSSTVAPSDPLIVLHRWDARRAAAYLADDATALRRLYAPGTAAGRADIDILVAYEDHGVRVTALTQQVLAARVLARGETTLSVRVRGRVAATADDGRRCVRLPTGPITTRELTLRRVGTRWLMVSVRAVRPAGEVRSPAPQ